MILLLTTYSLAHKNQVWAAWWLLPLCNAIYASAGPEHGLGFSHHPPLLLLLYITLAGLAHSFLLRVWRGWICTCARLGWEHPALWSDSASSSTKAFIAAAQLYSGEDTADLTPFSHQMQNQRTCNVSLFVCNQSQSTSKYMLIPVRQKYKYVCRKSVSKFVSECDKSGQQRAGNKFNLISVDDSYALPSAQATLPSPSTTHPPRPALWTI